MSGSRLRGQIWFLLLTLLLALATGYTGRAEGADYSYIVVARGEYSDNLINIKKKLYNNGYYDEDYDRSTLLDSTLDDMTMNALKTFAKRYPQEPQYDGRGKGLTAKAEYDLLYMPDFPAAIRRMDVIVYRDIRAGDTDAGDEIGKIQDRLIALGYLNKSNAEYRARELTGAVFDALDHLLDENHKPEWKRRDLVTAEVQELIFSDQVISNSASFFDKLRVYFLSSASLFGFQVPMLVIWIVGLLLLIACVLAIIHFFGPSDASGNAQKGPDRNIIRGTVKRGVGTDGTAKPGKGRIVRFEIAYGDKTQACELPVEDILEIGRNMTALPIDGRDNTISRRHCELYFRDGELMLRDYSRYGTNVNGEIINNTQRKLNTGDTIVVGCHQIRLTWKS